KICKTPPHPVQNTLFPASKFLRALRQKSLPPFSVFLLFAVFLLAFSPSFLRASASEIFLPQFSPFSSCSPCSFWRFRPFCSRSKFRVQCSKFLRGRPKLRFLRFLCYLFNSE